VVSLIVGLAVLYGACRALKIDELELASRAILGRFKRTDG
jgi:hypothetical protein